VIQVIVQYHEYIIVNRTCGSVRSSLSASAWLVTAGSKAAETTAPRLRARRHPRGSFRDCERQCGQGVRLDDRSNTSELLQASLRVERAKGADRLGPKGQCSRLTGLQLRSHGYKGCRCRWQGPTHLVTCIKHGKSNPSLFGGRRAARRADGGVDRGCWSKRMPSCNRTDRGCNITLPRKRADFQLVDSYEIAGRTTKGGKRK